MRKNYTKYIHNIYEIKKYHFHIEFWHVRKEFSKENKIQYILHIEASKKLYGGFKMERNVVIVPEEKYQKIKDEMKKENDYFTAFEYETLTQRLGEIWANEL